MYCGHCGSEEIFEIERSELAAVVRAHGRAVAWTSDGFNAIFVGGRDKPVNVCGDCGAILERFRPAYLR